MKLIGAAIAATILAFAGTSFAQYSGSSPPSGLIRGPVLGIPQHTLGEDGKHHLVVIYQGNGQSGTFTMTATNAVGQYVNGSTAANPMKAMLGYGESHGTWQWTADGRFCVYLIHNPTSEVEQWCKSNGHLIGRTPAYFKPS